MPPSLSARTPVAPDGSPTPDTPIDLATPASERTRDDPDDSPRVPVSNDTIAVYCRIRPTKTPSLNLCDLDKNAGTIEIRVPHTDSGFINNIRESFEFKFNGIFDHTATQEEVFNGIARPVVENALAGINGTIFAYGQTGSGKTYSITGGTDNYENRGIIPRALAMIFDSLQKRTDVRGQVSISYLEIYNQNGYDLLDPSHDSNKLEDLPRVSVIHDDSGNVHLKNLCEMPCATLDEALGLLFVGDTNRIICETPSNDASSRSHCIFTMHLEMRQTSGSKIIRSKIHLVDLAGSERVKKTDIKGKILTEARYINLSLHYLEQVIVALQQRAQGKKVHIPYRNSLLTSVLKDSLGGNCRTAMLATFSLESNHLDETVTTGRFAQRVAMIRNAAYVNEEIDPKLLIQRLKGQVRELREEVMALKGKEVQLSGLTAEDKERCQVLVQQFVTDTGISGKNSSGENSGTGSGYVLKGVRDDVDAANDSKAAMALQPVWSNRYKLGYCIELLRHMLLSAANNSQSTPGSSGSAAVSGGVAGVVMGANLAQHERDEYEQEIKRLKLLLQRKEQEISVLMGVTSGEAGKVGAAVVDAIARGGPVPNLNVIKGISAKFAAVKGDAEGAEVEVVDRAVAFEVFRLSYEHNDAIEENKSLLKDRIAAAKATGERINSTRTQISTFKSRVEKLRLTRGLGEIDGNGQSDVPESDLEEERKLLHDMEDCKRMYKSDFETLKNMKADIEGLQHTLEKQRRKMQTDFEKWLENGGQHGNDGSRSGRDSRVDKTNMSAVNSDNGRLSHRSSSYASSPVDGPEAYSYQSQSASTPVNPYSHASAARPSRPPATAAVASPVDAKVYGSVANPGPAAPSRPQGIASAAAMPVRNPYQSPLGVTPAASAAAPVAAYSSAGVVASASAGAGAGAGAVPPRAAPASGYDALFNSPLPPSVAPYGLSPGQNNGGGYFAPTSQANYAYNANKAGNSGYVSPAEKKPGYSTSQPALGQQAQQPQQQQPSWKSIMSVVGGNADSDLASFYRIRDEMMNKKS